METWPKKLTGLKTRFRIAEDNAASKREKSRKEKASKKDDARRPVIGVQQQKKHPK